MQRTLSTVVTKLACDGDNAPARTGLDVAEKGCLPAGAGDMAAWQWRGWLATVRRAPFPVLGIAGATGLLAGTCMVAILPVLPSWQWALATALTGMAGVLAGGGFRVAGLVLLGFGAMALHGQHALSLQLPADWERRVVKVEGRVVDLPDVQARRTRFFFRVDGDAAPLPLRGRLLRVDWYDDYAAVVPGPRVRLHAGARWQLAMRVRAPRGLSNPGGFDSERSMLAQRIAATGQVMDAASARALAAPAGLDAWRETISARIATAVAMPSSRFVRALALGDTHALGDGDWAVLRANGLTHLIAISGFHVGLAAGFFALLGNALWRVFPALGRRWPRPLAMALMALAGAGVYAAMAGFSLPTVRTLLMIAVAVLARLGRRPLRVRDALSLALGCVLLADPLSILAAGFWLSFAGVAWLMWCLPEAGQPRRMLADFLSAQGVATLGLLPLTVVLFGQASLAGPLANLVAIPWWSLVVVPLALLGTGAEALCPGMGEWPWRASAWCFDLAWPLFVQVAGSRFSLWWLPEGRWFALPLALLGAFWLLLPRGLPGKPLACLLWLPLLWPARGLPATGAVELQVLDVGQGLSVLVRTSRHALLYDTGPALPEGYDAGERVVVPALRALGSAKLDRIVVSHGDNDHAGGLGAVVHGVPVMHVIAPAGAPVPAPDACMAGQGWNWDGVRFRFLHPPPHFPYLRNESSCVLRVETAHGAILLTGDIGEVIERRLAREAGGDLRADLVVAPHHGSAGSSTPEFIAATQPRLVLVSAGYGNRFGHPRAEVVKRWRRAGAEVLATPDSGALRAWLGRDGLHVREQRAWHARWWDAAGRRQSAAILSATE